MAETRQQSARRKHAPGDLFAQDAAAGCELESLSASNWAQGVKAVGTLLWTCCAHTREGAMQGWPWKGQYFCVSLAVGSILVCPDGTTL